VTFGMNSVSWDGVQSVGTAATGGSASGSGSVVQGTTPGLPCVRSGNPAAAMAAGLVDVWSTIKLLITRGSLSKTLPFFCLYDEGAGGPNKGGLASASLNTAVVSRGNAWSAAPLNSCPATRLLHEPSTVLSPNDSSGLASWLGPEPSRAPQGPVVDVVFAT